MQAGLQSELKKWLLNEGIVDKKSRFLLVQATVD
jgi:hypothetical protein